MVEFWRNERNIMKKWDSESTWKEAGPYVIRRKFAINTPPEENWRDMKSMGEKKIINN